MLLAGHLHFADARERGRGQDTRLDELGIFSDLALGQGQGLVELGQGRAVVPGAPPERGQDVVGGSQMRRAILRSPWRGS
jgi:hypothetical protein